mmetsp:Transcript_210/g.538  ORF Transcript_210/g.538 Transcript_210/m.538 type:complete len:82 (+) Transcript_210:1195-1440(+)
MFSSTGNYYSRRKIIYLTAPSFLHSCRVCLQMYASRGAARNVGWCFCILPSTDSKPPPVARPHAYVVPSHCYNFDLICDIT